MLLWLTWVSMPSGSFTMNEWALATLAASSISTKVASGLPKSIFSLMVVANRAGSWLTSPICCLSHLSFNVFMSCPSSRTCPVQVYAFISRDFHSVSQFSTNIPTWPTWTSSISRYTLNSPTRNIFIKSNFANWVSTIGSRRMKFLCGIYLRWDHRISQWERPQCSFQSHCFLQGRWSFRLGRLGKNHWGSEPLALMGRRNLHFSALLVL